MKKLFISLSIVSLISVSILVFVLLNNRNKNDLTMNDENKNEIIESNNSIEEEEEILDESITDNDESIKSDSNVIHSNDLPTNKNNKKVNNSSNTNVINKQEKVEVEKEEIEEPQQEEIKEEPKPKEDVRDDIVDTNSFFYSIHHGKIEMSSQNKCLSAGEEIAFLDTVDINYYRCYEVTSTTGKILGYYLNIFCNSDNCNRYKNQIDMSKYR